MTAKEWWSWVHPIDKWLLCSYGASLAISALAGNWWPIFGLQLATALAYSLYVMERVRADRLHALNKMLAQCLEECGEAGIDWQRRSEAFEQSLKEGADAIGVANLIIHGRGPRPDRKE